MDAAPVDPGGSRRLVLPRFLRRPARALSRVEWSMPRYAGTKSIVVLFLTTAVVGTYMGGHASTVVSTLTAWSGLGIQEIEISGQSDASEMEILDRLAIGPVPSLLTLDLEAARERVESLDWVDAATLTKLFPNTLRVAVTERQPFAIWQNDGAIYLVDKAGAIISEGLRGRYRDLPYVVGPGAAERIGEFVSLVAIDPDLASRVRAGVLVSESRWTVILDNGIELLLPKDRPQIALRTIAALDADKQLLSREIAAVDFRFEKKAILRLTQKGISAREALLKDRAKLARQRASRT